MKSACYNFQSGYFGREPRKGADQLNLFNDFNSFLKRPDHPPSLRCWPQWYSVYLKMKSLRIIILTFYRDYICDTVMLYLLVNMVTRQNTVRSQRTTRYHVLSPSSLTPVTMTDFSVDKTV